jgi:hypothetical protein
MFIIDPFDKYAAAIPLKSKQPPDIFEWVLSRVFTRWVVNRNLFIQMMKVVLIQQL